ncbi:hypothetical protein K3495_g8550 [Podosphaera aphanis]|nr:hypothetical protein K3495_g8550 [Podosphaera aphanis]
MFQIYAASSAHRHPRTSVDPDVKLDELIRLVGDTVISHISKKDSSRLERKKWNCTHKILAKWINHLPNRRTLVTSDPLNMEDLSESISKKAQSFICIFQVKTEILSHKGVALGRGRGRE